MKVVAVVCARMGSTRFPGKVMLQLGGLPVLGHVVRTAFRTVGVQEVWVATSTAEADDAIERWCKTITVPCWRGSEADVLKRITDCARQAGADAVVRLTGDCPFLDSTVVAETVALFRYGNLDYAQNVSPATWPDGLDCEVVHINALMTAEREATRPSDRDAAIQYIERNRHRWRSDTLICPIPGLHKERWVLDTAEDWAFCQAVVGGLGRMPQSYLEMLHVLNVLPRLRTLNNMWKRNERFLAHIAEENNVGV